MKIKSRNILKYIVITSFVFFLIGCGKNKVLSTEGSRASVLNVPVNLAGAPSVALSVSVQSAFSKAKNWMVSKPGLGEGTYFYVTSTLYWGVGVVVAAKPSDRWVQIELTKNLKLKSRREALRGLAEAFGNTNRSSVTYTMHGNETTKVYEEPTILRVITLVSSDSVRNLQSSGKVLQEFKK